MNSNMRKNFLISYPRSGNHWVRFIIEWFSGKPTNGLSLNDPPIYKSIPNKNILSHVKTNDFIIHKSHGTPNQANKLILILRNPKECIYRHKKKIDKKNIDDYMSLIKFYDNHKKMKLLVYYEDLILSPKDVITDITKFLEIYNEKKMNNFMENYDFLFKESIKVYDNSWKTKNIFGSKLRVSETNGEKIIYHSNKINKKELDQFKLHIENKYKNIKKYISKYE